MARAAPPDSARAGARPRHLVAAPQLRGDGALEARARAAAQDPPPPRRAVPRAEPRAAGRRARAGVPRAPARPPGAGAGPPGDRRDPLEARPLPGAGDRPSLE